MNEPENEAAKEQITETTSKQELIFKEPFKRTIKKPISDERNEELIEQTAQEIFKRYKKGEKIKKVNTTAFVVAVNQRVNQLIAERIKTHHNEYIAISKFFLNQIHKAAGWAMHVIGNVTGEREQTRVEKEYAPTGYVTRDTTWAVLQLAETINFIDNLVRKTKNQMPVVEDLNIESLDFY